MVKHVLLSVLAGLSLSAYSQSPGASDPAARETIFYAPHHNPDWLSVKNGVRISSQELVQHRLPDLGLTEQDELVPYRTDTDALGFTHRRYQQYHKGVRVEGGELLLHEKDGWVQTLNGKLVRGLRAAPQVDVPAATAVQLALADLPANRYMWEDAAAEAMLRHLTKDPAATFYPQPELVLVDPSFSQNPASFQPAWCFEIYAQEPQSRKQVYVSSRDGKILRQIELLCDGASGSPGIAVTKYSGTHPVLTDSTGEFVYRLYDNTRGGGVHTLNCMQTTKEDLAIEFSDPDNIWDNFNPNQDEVATDIFWAAEMTYDYYQQKLGFEGLDGNNYPLISYVHYDSKWNNARWTGHWTQFGDGDGKQFGPFGSVDVVGHEFTHGVTRFTANLKYLNESGALNESFSDIFGAAVEFWADPEKADWLVGEDFDLKGNGLRNMQNPKEDENPGTYQGEFWSTGAGDNGGVHNNSGVQNHWFYLLTEGGSGANDKGEDYTLSGLGLDTAAAIAFRNLRYYLVQLSNYADAREGSLQAAADLYGLCSAPYTETAKAWYAVGVGVELLNFDLRMLKILDPAPLTCGLSDAEYISVQLRYNGCNVDLQPGDKIPLAFQINDEALVWDTLTLSKPLAAGDTLNYTFSIPTADLAAPGEYKIRCRTGFPGDADPGNNEAFLKIDNILDQNVDLALKTVTEPASSCFLGKASLSVSIGFFGCDSIAAGQPLTVAYSLDGSAPVYESLPLPLTLHRGQSFEFTFFKPVDFSTQKPYFIDTWVEYGPDSLHTNDSLTHFRVLHPLPMLVENVLSFESGAASLDSAYSAGGRQTTAGLSAAAAHNSTNGFLMTGGDFFGALEEESAVVPNANNLWNANQAFRSRLCICADLSNLASAKLRFERKQTYSPVYQDKLGFANTYASAMHILANGQEIAGPYRPVSNSIDPWFTYNVNLADYLGGTAEICFESLTGLSPAFDPTGVGDKVMLDNIAIVGQLVGSGEAPRAAPEWTIMPNPGNGRFTLSCRSPQEQAVSIDVVDALGRVVANRRETLHTGDNSVPMDLTGAAAGIYFVRLGLEYGQQTRRIVVE